MPGRLDQRDDPPAADRTARSARRAAVVPAVLLIVLGAASFCNALVGLIQFNALPGQIDDMIAQVEADPNMTREEKDNWNDILTTLKDMMTQPTAVIAYVVNMVLSGIVAAGGVQLLRLSGPALPTMSAVLAMIPCTMGCCCLFGFPVGIWALAVLFRPDVRITMARASYIPRGQE